MRGRPALVTSYETDQAPLGTRARRGWFCVLVVVLLVLPFQLDTELNALMATAFLAAIGAIGLNIVTGWAGQVSLGHAFFLGIGAYTGAALAGDPDAHVVGLGLDMVVWLPAAGLLAGLVGVAVAPVALRLRGLYLAVVTLGLVFVGLHLFRELDSVTGGALIGRQAPDLVVAGIDLDATSSLFGLGLDREINLYFLSLALLVLFAVLAKNLTRSATGRALGAVRDHDLAAEVMGVDVTRHKVIAFGVSAFYAGIAGAMLATVTGYIEPGTYDLFLSIQFLAIVLIGGIGTLSGVLMGAAFVTLLPRLIEELARILPFITTEPTGDFPTVFQLQGLIYGSMIVAFLILEPRGLFGLWDRARNYFQTWPFSYLP